MGKDKWEGLEEEEKLEFIIDIPNPYDLDGPWIEVARFDDQGRALKFVLDKFGGDENGLIHLITTLRDE